MKLPLTFRAVAAVAVAATLIPTATLHAALLAYEPFTNAPGTAIIGSGGGAGFSGAWLANGSSGVATNLGYGLTYTDGASNTLVTLGGAGFFQGLTSANTSMQPNRILNFSRGTNGTDGASTWISFLIVRQGPAGTLAGNPYGRGANVTHDFGSAPLQKLAVGNSSSVATNTVGLIPAGASGNLRSSTNTFGNFTNFVVVRIDHLAGANDNAWLFVNPGLAAEPSTNAASASSLGGFDFSFDRIRIFAGGQSSAAQPYAEMVVDEYRMGETYADVTPHTNSASGPAGPLVITNAAMLADSIALSGTGGSAAGIYYVLAGNNLAVPSTNWPAIATNSFNDSGRFDCVIPLVPGEAGKFFRLFVGQLPPSPRAPFITAQPQNLSVTAGQNVSFSVAADGTAPLFYQWYFNTNMPLANATGALLALTNVQAADAGTYSVVITNALGSVTSSNASLTVSPAPIAPTLSTQPLSLVVTQGSSATFSVAADGTAPLHYQWYFNTGTALANATNASLTVTSAQTNNAGIYSVVVTNAAGSIPSSNATLTVLVPPYIVAQPQSQSVIVSNSATFSVTAGGTAPLGYQWYFNTNTPLLNATNPSLAITSARFADAGAYSVLVSSSLGSVTSAPATLTVSLTVDTNGAYFVSPLGSDSNPGTLDRPFLTVGKGVTAVGTGGQLYIRSGTYALSSKLTLSKTASAASTIRLWAYPGETVVINSAGNSSDGISISGIGYHLKGLIVINAGHNGINISGSSNIVEFCTVHDNGNTGLHITGGTSGTTFPAYNLILNCDAYLNYDPPIGGNADGFSAKWDLGPGNVFSGCRAWWNSDDGWDLWMGNSAVLITNCWAFWQGTNYWSSSSFDGNGNGFKLGGNYVGAPHRLVRSVAFENMANGVDQNNNVLGLTVDQVTSWANVKANFALNHGANTTPHIVRNNLSIAGGSGDSFTAGTLATNNSWQVLSPAANVSDVLSVDTSVTVAPRQADGSLPVWPFLRPVPGGRLIDRGVDIVEPYSGAAPDLGAFESP